MTGVLSRSGTVYQTGPRFVHRVIWLPECNSIRRPQGSATEPEIYFRIVHVTPEARDGDRVAPYRDQTVEITLGPKGAFKNGNVGTLTRQVRGDLVVSAVPPHKGKPKPPKEPKTPRVAKLLRKAIE